MGDTAAEPRPERFSLRASRRIDSLPLDLQTAIEMVVRFSTPEEAALFAAYRRHEGYFADVCDDSVARFWGPLAVGGCRVVSSETRGEDQVEPSPAGPFERILFWILRGFVFVSLVLGIPALLYHGARPVLEELGLVGTLKLAGIGLAAFCAFVVLAIVMSSLTRKWRRALEGPPSLARLLFIYLVAMLTVLFLLLFFW